MKMSLALRPRRPLNRSEALGCLSANLALPGSGSLVAGRRSGYVQLILTAIGFAITCLTGVRFVVWYLSNWTAINQPPVDDPLGGMLALWNAIRWPLVGVTFFGIAMLWSLATSLEVLRGATKDGTPPKIE